MKIRLNGVWRELERDRAADCTDAGSCGADRLNAGLSAGSSAGLNLAAVLERLGYGQSSVATALNGEFVPARARVAVSVRDGDRLEVLAPMQGG